MASIHRKLVVVGDSGGKTSLLTVLMKGTFTLNMRILENHVADMEVDGKHVKWALWDTGDDESYDRIRPIAYPDSHVILICFDISNPDSLDSVQGKWISEVNHFCRGLPFHIRDRKSPRKSERGTMLNALARLKRGFAKRFKLQLARRCAPVQNPLQRGSIN
ncbi:hypothetical protein K443DRAFT_289883 [Laccaria amethystina LaAM-08-1]|uniref:Uncharacterized protein n=1 Tax=Laccaria amethystina LaAM-08-1 TaxID=1095629 RepID=A0A0C9XME3_9AGAR|nr:hypothetical protein K443DRAFT_289883 [Laccaria amethystina LaAM-08-1]